MTLFQITEQSHDVVLEIAYATSDNFTGKPIYHQPLCFLGEAARKPFERAVELAAQQGYRFKIFDAFRPQAAAQALWDFCPDPMYVAPPEKGSNHTRGVAIDLTLIDSRGRELEMGTPFDSFLELSHHGNAEVTKEAAANRYMLLGIMMSAGWDFFVNEWWHYQLFNPKEHPLILEDYGIMGGELMAKVG